ncbi:MAG: DUF4760 domain-containing protein [Symploca sp. SIO1C2]|nr:DUF4760 domain-containing protein [Symploca sp. SIO1C2]
MSSNRNFTNNPNIFAEFNLKITFNIFVLSILVSALTTAIYVIVPEEYDETLTFSVTTFAMSAGGLAAFYAYKSITQNKDQKMYDRTLSYIQRWNSSEFLPLRKTVKEIFQAVKQEPSEKQDQVLMNCLSEDESKSLQVKTLLNFLTEMAMCIEKEMVDEEFLKTFFQQIVLDYCDNFNAFINQRINYKHNKKLYKALLELHDEWKI